MGLYRCRLSHFVVYLAVNLSLLLVAKGVEPGTVKSEYLFLCVIQDGY